jgi:hypothetical protein
MSSQLIFNRGTDNYLFTIAEARGLSGERLRLRSSNSAAIIDICNNGIVDISATSLQVDATATLSSSLQVDGAATFSDSIDVSLDSSFNASIFVNENITVSNELIIGDGTTRGGRIYTDSNNRLVIDPYPASGDVSGSLIIYGDLQVDGTTTTINSTVVDISDLDINLAYNATTPVEANNGGIKVGTKANPAATFLYDNTNTEWYTNIGLDVSGHLDVAGATTLSSTLQTSGLITANGGIEVSGNVLPTNNNSQIAVTYNTFAVKNSDTVLVNRLSDVSNTWITATDYDLSINLLSQNSAVKIEFKVNYRASPEAEQYISFRVIRDTGSVLSVLFQDCSLGSIMGVTTSSVYNGTFIDTTPGSTTLTYYLEYRLDCPTDDSIDTQFGILGGSTNRNYFIDIFIFLV